MLDHIEAKITQARTRWLDTTSATERAMCERFVNMMLERWLKINDEDQIRAKGVRWWGSSGR